MITDFLLQKKNGALWYHFITSKNKMDHIMMTISALDLLLISSHFVITAAHCVKKYTPNKDKLTFKTIEEYLENQNDDLMKGLTIISNSKYSRLGKSPMQNLHHVEEIMIHPKYVST